MTTANTNSPLERALRDLAARWRRQRHAQPSPSAETATLRLGPATAFDALLQERINALDRGLDELKGRVNGLIFLVLGAVVTQLVLGLVR